MPRMRSPVPARRPTTLHIDKEILKALRLKAAVTGISISTLANQAFRKSLAEENRRIKVFTERRGQPLRPYEDFLSDLKRDGKI